MLILETRIYLLLPKKNQVSQPLPWFCPPLAPKHVSRPRPRSAPTPLEGSFSHVRPCSADPGAPPPPVHAPLHRQLSAAEPLRQPRSADPRAPPPPARRRGTRPARLLCQLVRSTARPDPAAARSPHLDLLRIHALGSAGTSLAARAQRRAATPPLLPGQDASLPGGRLERSLPPRFARRCLCSAGCLPPLRPCAARPAKATPHHRCTGPGRQFRRMDPRRWWPDALPSPHPHSLVLRSPWFLFLSSAPFRIHGGADGCAVSSLTAYLHNRRSSRKRHQGGTFNLILMGSPSSTPTISTTPHQRR